MGEKYVVRMGKNLARTEKFYPRIFTQKKFPEKEKFSYYVNKL